MIIAAFPGTGKTYLEKKYKGLFKDFNVLSYLPYDIRQYHDVNDKSEISINAIHQMVTDMINYPHVAMCLPTPDILEVLIQRNAKVTVVIPSVFLKQEYLQRYENRSTDNEFLLAMDSSYDYWLQRIYEFIYLDKIVLYNGKYLADIIKVDDNNEVSFNTRLSPTFHTEHIKKEVLSKLSTPQIKEWLFSISVPYKEINTERYYLSTNPNLSKVIGSRHPNHPDIPLEYVTVYEHFEGSWVGEYSKILDEIDDSQEEELDLYLYKILCDEDTRVIRNNLLTVNYLDKTAFSSTSMPILTKELSVVPKERITVSNPLIDLNTIVKKIPAYGTLYDTADDFVIITEPKVISRTILRGE